MRPAHPRRPARPLLLIGWDGAEPSLVGPWMADGTLPVLRQLARRGASTSLRSLVHPLSPACWTSAMTGLNPGRHGVWDFGHRAEGTYRIDPTDGNRRSGAALWEIAEEAGLRCVAINVPHLHPAPAPQRSVLVPGLGVEALDGATWPRSVADLIRREVPAYRVDANAYEHGDPAEFLAAVRAMTEARTRVAEALLRREAPDLLICIFVGPDRVQHAFWKQSALPWTDGARAGWRFAHAVRDCYRQLDEALGRLLEAAGSDATAMLVSDHGFGDLDGDLYLNCVLMEMGLLGLRGSARGSSPVARFASRFKDLRDRLPPLLSRAPTGAEAALPGFGDIAWERTRAYSRGLFGNVWLNLRGREPLGQVEPGPEAEALLDAIEARLLSLPDPQGRGRLVDAVFRGPQLYAGARAVDAPDLVVVSNSYRYMTRSGCEFGPAGVLVGPPAVRHSGNHRMDGILLAAGPGVRDGVDPGPQRLLDVAPTALALLGIEVPRGLDGRPMEALLSCGLGWTDELPERPMGPPGLGAGASAEPGAPAPDALERQLRALGYVAGPP